MDMPTAIGVIGCMLGIPEDEDRSEWFESFKPLLKDEESRKMFFFRLPAAISPDNWRRRPARDADSPAQRRSPLAGRLLAAPAALHNGALADAYVYSSWMILASSMRLL